MKILIDERITKRFSPAAADAGQWYEIEQPQAAQSRYV